MLKLLLTLVFVYPNPTAEKLIPQLGSIRFLHREAASNRLVKMGRPALPALRKGLKSEDPEIRHRCKTAIDKILNDELATYYPYPMIDAFWYDTKKKSYETYKEPYGSMYKKYGHYLTKGRQINLGYDHEIFGWTKYRNGTYIYVNDLIKTGVRPWVIKEIMLQMHRIDAVFVKNCSNTKHPIPFKDFIPYKTMPKIKAEPIPPPRNFGPRVMPPAWP